MNVARRAGTTSVATLLACAMTVVGAHRIAPRWVESVGLDVWTVPALRNNLEDHCLQERALTEMIEESQRRMEIKDALAQQLVEGRLSLKDAAIEFLALNRHNVSGLTIILSSYEGTSEEEKQARNVIDFTKMRLNGNLIQKLVFVARCEAALQRTYGSHRPKSL